MQITAWASVRRLLLASTLTLGVVPRQLSGQTSVSTTTQFLRIQLATCPSGDTLRPSADDAAEGRVFGYYDENIGQWVLQTQPHVPGVSARAHFYGDEPYHERWVELRLYLRGKTAQALHVDAHPSMTATLDDSVPLDLGAGLVSESQGVAPPLTTVYVRLSRETFQQLVRAGDLTLHVGTVSLRRDKQEGRDFSALEVALRCGIAWPRAP